MGKKKKGGRGGGRGGGNGGGGGGRCSSGKGCYNPECNFTHPNDWNPLINLAKKAQQNCRTGANCGKQRCPYLHPWGLTHNYELPNVNSGGGGGGGGGGGSSFNSGGGGGGNNWGNNSFSGGNGKQCNKGAACENENCQYSHPQGWNPVIAKKKKFRKTCNNDPNCTKNNCNFFHPSRAPGGNYNFLSPLTTVPSTSTNGYAFRVATFNVLFQAMSESQLCYDNTNAANNFATRAETELAAIGVVGADILCLQQVTVDFFESLKGNLEFVNPDLNYDYATMLRAEANDGCVIAVNTNRFQIVHDQTREIHYNAVRDNDRVALLALVRSTENTNVEFVVACTEFEPAEDSQDVRTAQLEQVLMESGVADNVPVIFGGSTHYPIAPELVGAGAAPFFSIDIPDEAMPYTSYHHGYCAWESTDALLATTHFTQLSPVWKYPSAFNLDPGINEQPAYPPIPQHRVIKIQVLPNLDTSQQVMWWDRQFMSGTIWPSNHLMLYQDYGV